MEKKLGVLPFSCGCVSQTSIAVGEVQSKKVKQESKYKSYISPVLEYCSSCKKVLHTDEKDKRRVAMAKMKKNSTVFGAPKTIFIGFWRFVKGIKNFPRWLGK